ncbi:MAG TPA: hypothetical protein VGJ74_23125 [Burkholderiales bacterium]|jgi:tripartite-type tricarboxylate transporter receptor subunit TctC
MLRQPFVVEDLPGGSGNAGAAAAARAAPDGCIPQFDTPAEFAAALARDRQFWAEFIRRAGVVPD